LRIRKARMGDIESVHDLINRQARQGRMLARSRLELYENLRDFFVAAERRRVHGAAALHISWENLAEIKSVAVSEESRGSGVGARLVQACLREASKLGASRVFVLTYVPEFFEKLGFARIDRSELPHRVWAECVRCAEFPDCGEIPLAREVRVRNGRRGRRRRAPVRTGRPRAKKGSRRG
jgi:amino-acid N-acetyltransferase